MAGEEHEISKVNWVPHVFDPLPGKRTVCTRCSRPKSDTIHVDEDPAPVYEPIPEVPSVYDTHQS